MSGTICDALMSNTPGNITFAINRKLIGQGITANDEEVARAVSFAFRELKLVVEPGGAIGLAALLAVSRSFQVETENAARDGLRLSGLDPAAVFLGKAGAIAVQLAVLEVALGAGVALLYDVELRSLGLLVAAAVAATAGVAATGTLYGVLAAGLRVRETLVPLLLLPVVAPVMLGATRAWEAGLGRATSDGWPWVALLALFATLYTSIGMLAFGSLLEEA